VSAVESLEGSLLQVEGLSDLRLELHSKKMNLHLVLIDELHRHLYIKSTNRVVQRNKEKGKMRLVKRLFASVLGGSYRKKYSLFSRIL
jgi:exocyst complex component 4